MSMPEFNVMKSQNSEYLQPYPVFSKMQSVEDPQAELQRLGSMNHKMPAEFSSSKGY
jgi:hypothetical protein